MKHIFILVLSSLGVLGCYKISKLTDNDTGTDADADADTDTDTDTDTDADTDTDTDTDTDADTDTDTDNGSDLDKNTDTDFDTDIGTGPDTDTATDTGMDVAPDCADGNGRFDETTGLCWQHPKATNEYGLPNEYDWREAIDYCNRLSLGGHDDWRLPSKENFMEMLGGYSGDYGGACDTCSESATCTALFGSDIAMYWSSTPDDDPGDDDIAWHVDFKSGGVNPYGTYYCDARCVRSGP